MRSGQIFSHLVELVGVADGDLVWVLTGDDGTNITSGTITPPAQSISVAINVPGTHNTLTGAAMWGNRELAWSYLHQGIAQGGHVQYNIEGRVPFGVTPNGVRTKIGLSAADDLSDDEIPLVKAYLVFRELVGENPLLAATTDLARIVVADAIEARAALDLLPTLQVRVAQQESSGTNQFQRAKIDWAALEAALLATITAGELAVDPAKTFELSGSALLLLVTPDTDLFPGA